MFYLTEQEKKVLKILCLLLFMGSLIHIGQERNPRIFDWMHRWQKHLAVKSISINQASCEELLSVPGIGPKTAGFIMAHRPFRDLNQLRQAKGMSDKRYERIVKYFKL